MHLGVCSSATESDSSMSSSTSRMSTPDSSRPSSAAGHRPDSSCSAVSATTSADESFNEFASPSNVHVDVDSDANSRPSSAMSTSSTQSQAAVHDLESLLSIVENVCDEDSQHSPSLHFVGQLLSKLRGTLPNKWIPIADSFGIHLLYLSGTCPEAVQREVVVKFNGRVSVFIHGVVIIDNKQVSSECFHNISSLAAENEVNLLQFCLQCVQFAQCLLQFDVCVGANHSETHLIWDRVADSFIDKNPYRESTYVETCRSTTCEWLVKLGKGFLRCKPCNKIIKNLRVREKFLSSEDIHPNTRNDALTLDQSQLKLAMKQEQIRQKDKKIEYLSRKLEKVLDNEGVEVEESFSKELQKVLEKSKLTAVQKWFIEEQALRSGKKDPRAHRWHPTLIRWALHIHSKSSTTYEAMRESGVIALPHSRTLFNYSHAIKAEEGVSYGILKLVHEKVQSFDKDYEKYHVLLCDEMYISQNLVYKSADNSLVGYSNLDEVDMEMARFDAHVERQFSGEEKEIDTPLAKTILAFMVKGITTDVKFVVAAFPLHTLSAEMLYSRSWDVIGALERAAVKVLVYICDGSPINRAFIAMHVPVTKCDSGAVFDTINFCAPDRRPLIFISDVCHLIKTARNCFYNSGVDAKKPRCLTYNNEKIVWSSIVRLYLSSKNDNFRKSYKLNAQNVFPNAFSCMKVKYAAQVLSETVALDLVSKQWPGTSETVEFIRKFNKFFDVLNGAHSSQAARSRNPNLAAYTSADDPRIKWLEEEFLGWLKKWKEQVMAMPISAKQKEKLQLSWQTLIGLETSIRGFKAELEFMFNLPEPPKFIMARSSSQDPLEQHFGGQRQGRGGSRNPNASQFLSYQVKSAVVRNLGVTKRGANVEGQAESLQVTSEPVPKLPRKSSKK